MNAAEATPERAAAPTIMNPELLMAARNGDMESLKRLLDADAALVPPARPVAAAATADDEESRRQVILEVDRPAAAAAAGMLLLEGVTSEGDSALHVVAAAACGTGEEDGFLKCADAIYGAAGHLLRARNSNGDTPLHRASSAGSVPMVRKLIGFAKAEDGNQQQIIPAGVVVVELLRAQNKRGETALHEAIRSSNEELVAEDAGLARVPGDGTSPIYLAISLRELEFAKKRHDKDDQLSYSGPEGRNALHVAVLIGKGPTKMILGWAKGLAKQGDKKGRTPLHFAASTNRMSMRSMVKVLLEHDISCVYQPDEEGCYPIHVGAALGGLVGFFTVKLMIKFCPDSAGLRDSTGRTFLQVAVDNSDPLGDNPDDSLNEKRCEKEEREKLSGIYKEAAQNLTIGAVLIVTVTFAATFTMPGGYVSSDDDRVSMRGTPTLAGTYTFDAFVIANTLAFLFSGMATFSLMYAGYMPLDFAFREVMGLLHSSVRSVGAAFLTATYVTLAHVAPKVVIAVYVGAGIGLLYINFEVWMLGWMTLALLFRGDLLAALVVGLQTVAVAFWFSWPFAVISVLPLILKGH
uniref:PGG domain-containing protein n=1 Tax=Leersia perrieri TaxID=77586 RepID=A0A0D9XBQ7_9ORYZ